MADGIDSSTSDNPLADVTNVADISGGNPNNNDAGNTSTLTGMVGQVGYFAAGFVGVLILSAVFGGSR